MSTTLLYLQTWIEARTRFTNLLKDLQPNDLSKKLEGTRNSAGFLIRHIGDVELLFTKNVFGAADLKVSAKTVIVQPLVQSYIFVLGIALLHITELINKTYCNL
jgi:hypothetical protein